MARMQIVRQSDYFFFVRRQEEPATWENTERMRTRNRLHFDNSKKWRIDAYRYKYFGSERNLTNDTGKQLPHELWRDLNSKALFKRWILTLNLFDRITSGAWRVSPFKWLMRVYQTILDKDADFCISFYK